MGQLFFGSGADLDHLHMEVQGLVGQGVVACGQHAVLLDLHDGLGDLGRLVVGMVGHKDRTLLQHGAHLVGEGLQRDG